jgi:hypothetical protein
VPAKIVSVDIVSADKIKNVHNRIRDLACFTFITAPSESLIRPRLSDNAPDFID